MASRHERNNHVIRDEEISEILWEESEDDLETSDAEEDLTDLKVRMILKLQVPKKI